MLVAWICWFRFSLRGRQLAPGTSHPHPEAAHVFNGHGDHGDHSRESRDELGSLLCTLVLLCFSGDFVIFCFIKKPFRDFIFWGKQIQGTREHSAAVCLSLGFEGLSGALVGKMENVKFVWSHGRSPYKGGC